MANIVGLPDNSFGITSERLLLFITVISTGETAYGAVQLEKTYSRCKINKNFLNTKMPTLKRTQSVRLYLILVSPGLKKLKNTWVFSH